MADVKRKDWSRTKAYKELKNDLLQGLKEANLDTPKYRDLVEEYMTSWCQLQDLNRDIIERGAWVPYQNGTQSGMTENKSLGVRIRLRRDMGDIFRELGFQDEARTKRSELAKANAGDDDDDNEM